MDYSYLHTEENEAKRVESRHKYYNSLSDEEKKELSRKRIEARKMNWEENNKFKQTLSWKYYTKNWIIKFSWFYKYTRDIIHTLKSRVCKYCGKWYYHRKMGKDFCSKECYERYRTEIGRIWIHKCKMCWKEFKPRRTKNSTYCSVQCANRDRELNHCIVSSINLRWNKRFESLWYETYLEFPLWELSYDIKVWDNILVEVNPSAFHSWTWSPYWDKYKKSKMYHYNKTHYAIDNWYKCINIWDRTKEEDVLEMINKDFVYEWPPNLHRVNRRTWELYEDKNDDEMVVGICDWWNIIFN